MNARELVLDMLLQITEEKKMYHTVLSRELDKHKELEKQDRAFAAVLCSGCLERLLTLDYLIDQYSSTRVAKMKPVIRNLLRMGFYQLYYMQVPPSAVCNEAVKLAKKRGFSGLSGFVNGVLRSTVRKPVDLNQLAAGRKEASGLSICYSMPEWLVKAFLEWYGAERTERMLQAFMAKKELVIHVNISKTTPKELKRVLEAEQIKVRPGAVIAEAFHLEGLDSIDKLTAFRQGMFQVQDESSQLPVICAGLKAGDRVIDCCAAPGGKALQAADTLLYAGRTAGDAGYISARDISEYKLGKIRENLQRSGFTNMELCLADALKLRQEDIATQDVVLADLPCSGLGIIGRKPDIRYNITPKSLEELAQLQREILAVVVQYLKPGGVLIYSTCTINPQENRDNAAWISETLGLKAESLNEYLPEMLHSKETEAGQLQLLPETGKTDGFFVCRFRKI